ncbi:LysM peptidoglycan-binding domain-containing protein [Alkalibacter saccharofermentans]|uniref:Polysaccharide deacetylase family sporulation protein PdaB/delta-lactam-biosynthetic de-N-acetylase,TIGR02884 n=1 Tax=Alkalibacter saccharofermentans DSM 14828 TaxID=1120975 RepID=A0A1M4X470_9FIRM|nr:LysM peptidoglycan-binding domain-containing protein [Alkalibacter saccharofermentans]SHE88255.1 polysaccharide deacetylase family sporulation protein PdaB/delta-lactam-biosynthetic de-N-acetylase,TIGR02884 [Alkalibacter saccharofermentans DSM 14828]
MYLKTKLLKIISFAAVLLLLASAPVFSADSQLITKGSTTEKLVALTFDDGDDGKNINPILDILAKNNIKATFFVTGRAAEHHPDLIKKIDQQGHIIGNHSYSHPDFTKITAAKMTEELSKVDNLIKNITGKSTKPYFRPPFGAYNASVLKAVGAAGYTKTIYWTIDTIDWRGDSVTDITNRVRNNIKPGAIVLMHTGSGAKNTVAALPGIISNLKSQGYKFVTLNQLLGTTQQTTYVVKAGDTLYGIARRYGVTVTQIANANNITNINLIRVGQVLIIPGTGTAPQPTPQPGTQVRYTVKAGDTLSAIARRYGVTVTQLANANNITNVNLIRVGQVLIIPGTGTAPQPTPQPGTQVRYTVKAGDTLSAIAGRYGVTVTRIAAANNIKNVNLIYVNQVLVIPQ